ncbi:hypothetical protein L195_g050851 [Trifolium pratense]|uniref:Uncharacterized protein n=1 Tax=Trifolium pratense TaxID=57577 RepID=A0A2K3JW91_TRIPR|nr:hypothetical protein L195_g050851 [Trifolium pratense]
MYFYQVICSGPSIDARAPEDVEQIHPEQAYHEEPARLARLSNGLILSRIVTAVNRNDGHLLHIKAPKPFSGSHLMAINAIKGIGPALGAIYM